MREVLGNSEKDGAVDRKAFEDANLERDGACDVSRMAGDLAVACMAWMSPI